MTQFDWHDRYQQQAHWTNQLRHYLLSKVNIKTAKRICEVGCGTGAVLSDPELSHGMALFGVDINESYLHQASQVFQLTNLCVGDGVNLPYPDACFDLSFCHFLLLWVQDPSSILKEMIRVTHIGGNIIAMAEPDYGGRIDYPEKFRWIGQLQKMALENQGANPEIGRRLSSLFATNKLRNIETGVLGGQWIQPNDSQSLKNEWAVLREDLQGLLPENIMQQYEEMDAQSWRNQARTIFVPTYYAIGQV
jgi:ubiquinone/menaquinone biosynthesis C-methylase UbiE